MAWFSYMAAQCIFLLCKALSTDSRSSALRLKSFFTFDVNSLDSDHTLYHTEGIDTPPRRWRLLLLASTPHIFLSLTYLFFNNILTKMVAEREWQSFFHGGTGSESGKKKTWMPGVRRKGQETQPSPTPKTKTLRTSQPRGSQRSIFFLSLPYRYALPFVVVFSVMHWLMSQCLYFTEVDFVDLDGTTLDKSNPTTSTLGYSTWAMFWVIVLGTLSWVAILGLGGARRRREGGDGDEEEEGETDIAAGPLSWGVIRQVVVRDGVEVEEKWLGFTRGEAERPVVGEVYG
ncbi:hypothetical protein N0V85_006732 [Neurospora sp. IMI 360204]|nr:hypothetical protein N0V85_006732 [Neurospora sp. IMI 360204]